MMTNWRKNIRVFTIDSVLNWFYVPIGVWVLIWNHYLTFPQIALVYSIALFWELLVEIPSGALADLMGRKKTVMLGRFFNVLGYIVFIYDQSFWGFVLSFMLHQTNWSLESGALSALLYDSLKENGQAEKHYQNTEARTFMYCTLGMAAASILGGVLYQGGLLWPYYAVLIVSIASFIASCFYDEPKLDSIKFTLNSWATQNIEGFKHIFRHPAIARISVFSIVISFIGYTGLWYLYEPRLAVGGFDPRLLSWLVAGTYIMRAIGTMLIRKMQTQLKSEQVPVFLVLIQMLGSVLSYVQGSLGAISSVYIRKFADGFRVPILANMQNREIDSKYRATALSAITLLYNLLVAAAGLVIGWANGKFGIPFTLGFFFWIGLIVALPLALRMKRND
jgi:MFS family permease